MFTALAFVRPRWHLSLAQLFEARWRWLKWVLLIALWMAVFKDRDLLWKLSNTFRIGVNPGFVLLILVLAASIKWFVFSQWLRREYWRRDYALQGVLTMGVIVLLVLGLLLNFRWNVFAGLSLGFGFKSADGLVPVIAFLLAVSAILDWRLILMLLVGFFASEVAVSWLGEMFTALSNGETDAADGAAAVREAIGSGSLSRTYFNWVDLNRGITAVLLGVAIAPFWRDQDPASLRINRTRLFLILALVVLFFGMPNYTRSIGSTGLMLVGCAAYIMGLIWQVRGIIAGPLLIQMLYLLGQIVGCIDDSCHANAYELVNIAFVAFVFGFFGLLSNRYQVHPSVPNELGVKEDEP
ncbi:MAG: hypothetical protein AAES65_11785 [Candidatus Thiodiazotropha sp. (ex. Lucinoma kazani)]